MKKRMKSLVALGLVMCMTAGCGSTTETETEKPTESKSAAEKQSEAIVESVQPQESIYPEYLNLDGFRPIVNEGEDITLKIAVKRSDHAINELDDVWLVKFIEEKLNINLEIEELTSENLSERKTLMFASGDLPDLMINLSISTSDVMKYGVDEKLLMPISDYFSEELTPNLVDMMENFGAACAYNTASDGKMYTMPTIGRTLETSNGSIAKSRVFVDSRYLDAAGIEEMPDTLDGYVDMLRKFKALDPAELGVEEIYPLAAVDKLDRQYLYNAFGWMAFDGNDATAAVWDVETDEVVIPALTQKYGEYLKLMNTLYTEGLLHTDYFTMDSTASKALFSERTAAVMADHAPYLTQAEKFDEWESVKPLKSQWNEEGATVKGRAYSTGKVFISADTEYPELCLRLLDWFYSPEGALYEYYGCPAGSEDTLGMIDGFTLDEAGTFTYGDIGSYESDYVYRCNVIELFEVSFYTDLAFETASEMTGWTEAVSDYDMTNGDTNYRVKVMNAFDGPLEEALPSVYVPVDKSERYADLHTVIKDYVEAESAKFIVGQRPLSEIDAFFKELEGLGSEEYTELVKSFYANYVR